VEQRYEDGVSGGNAADAERRKYLEGTATAQRADQVDILLINPAGSCALINP